MLSSINYLNKENWVIDKSSIPYPFAKIDNFLTSEVYQLVKENFPKLDRFNKIKDTSKSNVAVVLSFSDFDKDQDTFWYEFGKYFVRKEFFYDFCNLYIDDIERIYPHIYKKLKNQDYKIGIYNKDSFEKCDVLLDFGIGINTSVKEKSSVRKAHLDNTRSLYTALCYLKDDDDITNSGHFMVYGQKPNRKIIMGERRSFKLCDLIEYKSIDYNSNRLATFINTDKSIHGVTPREITDKERKFFTFTAIFNEDLYTIEKFPKNKFLMKIKTMYKKIL